MPGFFTIQQVSVGSLTPKRSWAPQKFGWFPSESHPLGLSSGKKLCLFSTKLALLSPQRILCSPTLWSRVSVVVIIDLAHLKIVPSTARIDKTRKPDHNILLRGSDANSRSRRARDKLFQKKTLMHPFIYRKQTLPVCTFTALLKSFHCQANNPPRHKQQWTHPEENIRLQRIFIHLHLVPTWVSCPGKCEGRQWNMNFREGKKARNKLVLWLLALLYKARKKVTILCRM